MSILKEQGGRNVSRREIYPSPSSSPSPAALDEAFKLHARLQLESICHEILENNGTTDDGQPQETAEVVEENVYDFRLFSVPTNADAASSATIQTTKILLDDDLPLGEGAFIVPSRTPAYYFTAEPTVWQRQAYESAAVDSANIQRWSCLYHCHGSVRPREVVVVSRDRRAQRLLDRHADSGANDLQLKRCRPHKQERIKSRKARKECDLLKQQEAQAALARVKAVEEKRVRRNREKNLKKRAKAKAARSNTEGVEPAKIVQ